MSTENLPVKWEEELAREAKEVAALETPALAKISLQAGVMQYQGVAVPGNKMECIILAMAFERRFDTKPFDPSNISPPDCFSLSLDDSDDVGPWPTIEEPQSDTCATCIQNQWQPNPRKPGKNHKPCKERRRLIIIPKSALETGILKAEMAMITVPVTSIRYWGAYVNQVAAAYRRAPWRVVTEISVHPDPRTQFAVKFATVDVFGEEYFADISTKRNEAIKAVLQPWDVIPLEKQENAPPPESDKKPKKY
jgi:hypothetical protein